MSKSIATDLLGGTSCSLPQHRYVSWWMLYHKRQYVIHKIKAPIMKAVVGLNTGISWFGMLIAFVQIVYYAKRYPEPTKDHTMLPRTHILIDTFEKFEENNSGRRALFAALWRMFIIEYEHDPFYRYRVDWIVDQLNDRGWGHTTIDTGSPSWKKE